LGERLLQGRIYYVEGGDFITIKGRLYYTQGETFSWGRLYHVTPAGGKKYNYWHRFSKLPAFDLIISTSIIVSIYVENV